MRSIPSFIVIAVLAAGCTSVLGIDDDYVLENNEPAGSGGFLLGSGGTTATTGGAPPASGGGRVPVDSSVPAPGNGGGSEDSGAGCRPGHFSGSFDGAHTVEIVVPIPATVSAGAVISFDLVSGASGTLAVEGSMNGGLQAVNITGAALIAADLTGDFDCKGGTLSGHLTGHTTVIGVMTPVAGTWKGTLDAAGKFSGTWTESGLPPGGAEAGAPLQCTVGVGLQGARTGCGTWRAE